MFTRRSPQAAPVAAAPPVQPETPEELRAGADQARAEAEVLVTTARAQAERLVAEAETRARQLTAGAAKAERKAAVLEQRAALYDLGRSLHEQADEKQQHADDLAAETRLLTEQTRALEERLAGLGVQRENANGALASAREAGDVAGVTAGRAELAAIDEVVAVLTGQRDTARGRFNEIGEAGWGTEFDKTVEAVAVLRRQAEDALDVADPGRVDRRREETAARFMEMAQRMAPGVEAEDAARVAVQLADLALDPSAIVAPWADRVPGAAEMIDRKFEQKQQVDAMRRQMAEVGL